MIERFDPYVWCVELVARALLRPEAWLADLARSELERSPAATQRAIVARLNLLVRRRGESLERCDRVVRAGELLGRTRARPYERRGLQRARAGDHAGAQVDLERALELRERAGRERAAERVRRCLARVLAARGRSLEAEACTGALGDGARPPDRPGSGPGLVQPC